jgi:YHS domain-containing protein
MVRCLTLLSGIVLALGLCRTAWSSPRLEYPRPCPTACVPNSEGFGYFRTTWRQWPGEPRPAQTNPRSINAEQIPTPEGQEQVPLPRGMALPHPPQAAPEGGILPPPEGGILPPLTPGTPFAPLDGSSIEKPSKPPMEGGLPGLPIEPDQSPSPKSSEGGNAPGSSSDLSLPSALPPADEKPQEKPKKETKSEERSKPKDATKSSPTDKPSTRALRESPERITTSAAPFGVRDSQGGAVVSLADELWPERHGAVSGVARADSIAAVAFESPTGNVEPAAYATVESAAQVVVSDDVAAVPSIALNGYCPVELTRNGCWTRGDLRWTVVYQGWIYRLSGPAQRQEFLANPDAFVPTYAGDDPVLAVDEHRKVPGQVAYCTTYNGRLYMFSSAATQSRFSKSPQRYVPGK